MSKFSFNCLLFSDIKFWSLGRDLNLGIRVENSGNEVFINLTKLAITAHVVVKTSMLSLEMELDREEILAQFLLMGVDTDANLKKVADFNEALEKTCNLSFQGPVWVKPVFALHDEVGHFQRTYIEKGRQMTWTDFMSSYLDGSLWNNFGFERVETDENWTISPVGALVAPSSENKEHQPITNREVYVAGNGAWRVRGDSDPNYFSWAFAGPDCKIQGVIPELAEAGITLRD